MRTEKTSFAQGTGVVACAAIFAASFVLITANKSSAQSAAQPQAALSAPGGETTQDYNRRLLALASSVSAREPGATAGEYHIGPEDLLELSVFDAPDLSRTVRVSGSGEISLPILGVVRAADLTPRELEIVLQELLRRSLMKNPQVSIFVREMQSHPVSVIGAVKKPGVFQIRGAKTVLEMLSMAEGLAEDAGDTVYVMHGASLEQPAVRTARDAQQNNSTSGPASGTDGSGDPPTAPARPATREINLKDLLESTDPANNAAVYPGDIVKVARAGIIYVVGEVKKPGGFVLKTNENISVLQALALGEGLTYTAAKSKARIIRTNVQSGKRTEIPVDLGHLLSGKAPDPLLLPKDILFVPNSDAKSGFYRAGDAAISIVTGVIIWRR